MRGFGRDEAGADRSRHAELPEIMILSSEGPGRHGRGKRLVVGAHGTATAPPATKRCRVAHQLYGIEVPEPGGDTQFTKWSAPTTSRAPR